MENESFPLSEDLILLSRNREALKEDSDLALYVFQTIEKAKDYTTFFWCLTNLHNFQTNEAREFAINNIYHFIYSTWHQIPENIYPLIIDELFTKIWEDPNFQDKSYHSNIFKTQNLVAYGLYPNFWPNFFDFLLKLPKPNLYGFLSIFNYSTYNTASTSNRNIDKFMNSCLNDGSQAKILQVVVNDVFDEIEGAASSLVSTVEWISLSLLLDSEVISSFVQLMEQSDTCSTGLEVFIKITHRPIAQDILYDLVTQLQLDEIIQQIASEFENNEKIIILCSELLFSSFDKLVSSDIPSFFDIIPNLTDLSMNLFMLPSPESTTFNRRLLMSIFGSYPMIIEDYFPMLASKIAFSISLESESADKITETALRLFFDAARISGVDITPHLLSLADSLNPNENIVEISVFLKALNEVLSAYEENQNELKLNLAEIFSPLLSIQPPFYIPHFVAMSSYLQIIIQIIKDFDDQIIADIFIRCIGLIMCKECEDIARNDRENLIENIFNIVQAKPNLISTISEIKEILPDFIQSGDINLIKSASLITSELEPEERFQIYSTVLPYFATELKLSISPEGGQSLKRSYIGMFSSTKSKLLPVLSFLIFSKADDLEPLKPMLIEFYTSLYNEMGYDINETPLLFSLFCRSSINALGFDALDIFIKTTDLIFRFENANAIIEASFPLANSPPYDENIKFILLLIDNVIGRSKSDKRKLRYIDEELQKRDFFIISSEFLMLVIPNLQEDEYEHEFSNSISNLVYILMSMKLPNEIMNKVVLFFSANPAVLADRIEDIFLTFMSNLATLAQIGSDEDPVMKDLIINFLKLLKQLTSLVPDQNWESPKWNRIADIGENGPDIMNQIMKCPDDEFESMVNEFLEDVEPPKQTCEDGGFVADAEDDDEYEES